MWEVDATDGYPAIGDFDADGRPEVVLVGGGEVRVVDGLTGEVEMGPVTIPEHGEPARQIGGAPTVADFDGDGRPEIGVAGSSAYVVIDGDGSILWEQETRDRSSGATGSSVFDFEGDGAAEVVYADECALRVYRGSDGHVLLELPKTSGTIVEYPLIVDVDGDGSSEMVTISNPFPDCADAASAPAPGVRVYRDARDQWMRTRRVWNEHAYHVTNVGVDGAIPRVESPSWSSANANSYRLNTQGEGTYNAPDLRVLGVERVLAGCPGTVTIRARIQNIGSLGVRSGVPVTAYVTNAAGVVVDVRTSTTTELLLPGASATMELSFDASETATAVRVVVDDDGSGAGIERECDESNNGSEPVPITCLI